MSLENTVELSTEEWREIPPMDTHSSRNGYAIALGNDTHLRVYDETISNEGPVTIELAQGRNYTNSRREYLGPNIVADFSTKGLSSIQASPERDNPIMRNEKYFELEGLDKLSAHRIETILNVMKNQEAYKDLFIPKGILKVDDLKVRLVVEGVFNQLEREWRDETAQLN